MDLKPLRILAVAGKLSTDSEVRYAALMHGLASILSEQSEASQTAIAQVAQRLPVEKAYRELALMVHQHYAFFKMAAGASADALLAGLEALDALRRAARFERYMAACQAVAVGEGWDPSTTLDRLKTAFSAAQAVTAKELGGQGLEGEGLAQALRRRRVNAISTTVGFASA
jgi:tRNA nucleotidyltransferase (CCA-adding enzyme)